MVSVCAGSGCVYVGGGGGGAGAVYGIQARSQAEAMKPGLQHKFGNLIVFSPQTCSDDIKWARPQHFLQDQMSAKQ